jgi:hypothetical protein
MNIKFRDVIEFLFLPLMSAAVFLLWNLNQSVGTLNVQVGVLLANNVANEKRLDGLEKRIEKMEEKIISGNLAAIK